MTNRKDQESTPFQLIFSLHFFIFLFSQLYQSRWFVFLHKNMVKMKDSFGKSRILISVFKEFGIPITGARKKKQFFSEIPVDRFYVEGILFELESRLGVLLEEEENELIQTPLDVIRSFKGKNLA